MSINERVKDLCKEKGISLNKLEQEIGVASGYLSKLDNPGIKTVKLIADYFNVSVDYLMTGEEKEVFVTDYRETKEPTIAKGDTVIVYGRGAGTATLTEKEKNALGITKDSEKTLIPSINMIYVELAK